MTLLEEILVIVAAACIGGVAGLCTWLWYLRGTGRQAKAAVAQVGEDEHWADVRRWRDDNTAHLKPVTVVASAPLPADVDWPERAAAFAEMVTGRLTDQEQAVYGAGRHRRAGLLDVRLPNWQRPTAAFKAYVKEETGQELESIGPAERIVHRRIEWTDETGWQQPELEVGI